MEDTKPEETNVEEQKVSIFEDFEIKQLQSVRFELFRYLPVRYIHTRVSPIESKTHRIKSDFLIKPAVIPNTCDYCFMLCLVSVFVYCSKLCCTPQMYKGLQPSNTNILIES